MMMIDDADSGKPVSSLLACIAGTVVSFALLCLCYIGNETCYDMLGSNESELPFAVITESACFLS